MPRLPNVGDDSGTWGTVLNEYLGVSHTPDGKLMFEKWADNASRPAAPTINQVGFNQDTEVIEQYDGTSWVTLVGGIQNNTIDPTKLNAQTQMLERFVLRPNGHIVAKGVLPEVGTKFFLSGNAVSNPPYVNNGSMVGNNNTLYYVGGEHSEVIKSITFEVEFKKSPLYPAGVNFSGITLGFSKNPLFFENNNNFGLPLDMLHFINYRGGPSGYGINAVDGSVGFNAVASYSNGLYWGPTNGSFIPYNVKTLITCRFEGDEFWVTCMGYTQYFKDPRIAQDGLGCRWWWYENGGDTPNYREYAQLHRMWINSPAIDLAPGANQPFSEILARISSGGNVTLPQRVHVFNQDDYTLTFPTGNPDGTEALAVAGVVSATKLKAKPYADHGTYSVPYNFGYLTAPLSSAVNASDQNISGAINFFGLNTVGEREEWVIRGYFANNSNSKRVKITWALGTMFDSGALTTANKEWELKFVRTFQTGISHSVNITFTVNGENPILLYYSSNYGTNAIGCNIRFSGIAAGDVVMRSVHGAKSTL